MSADPHLGTYLVTGASRGIGRELVRQLRSGGASVIAGVRDPDAAKALEALGARTVQLDVTDARSIESLSRRLGETPIDVLINNAGVSSTSKTLGELSAEELMRVMQINAIAPMLVTRAVIGLLRAGRRKLICQITSQLGSIANNTGGSSYGYRASKAALNQFNRSLAAELGPEGFCCVAVHPGWVRTDMGGPNATLSVEESARSILSTLAACTGALNGAFVNHDGTRLPW